MEEEKEENENSEERRISKAEYIEKERSERRK